MMFIMLTLVCEPSMGGMRAGQFPLSWYHWERTTQSTATQLQAELDRFLSHFTLTPSENSTKLGPVNFHAGCGAGCSRHTEDATVVGKIDLRRLGSSIIQLQCGEILNMWYTQTLPKVQGCASCIRAKNGSDAASSWFNATLPTGWPCN